MSEKLATTSPGRRGTRGRRLSSYRNDGNEGETFWGVELSTSNREETWNSREEAESEEDAGDRDYMHNQLIVKMAVLGKGLPKDEEHVVEVETVDKEGKPIKMPVLNMLPGVNNTVVMDLSFSDKSMVLFRLAAGCGPVYLSGSCVQEYPPEEDPEAQDSMYADTETTATEEDEDEEDLDDLEEEEEEEEDEEMEEVGRKGKVKAGVKRKSVSPHAKGSKAKRGKMEVKESEDESEEDDEDDDEDEEIELGAKKKKGAASTGPKGKGVKKAVATKADKKKGAKKVKAK